MKVSGTTQLFGIIGWPVGHTLSPVMHNAAYEALGIPAVYVPFPVKPEELGKAVMCLKALGICGINVTLPYKGGVIEFLDDLDPSAKKIGAVNCIAVKNGKLFGYNTDGAGALQSLRKDGHFDPEGKKIVVLGAGGAAAAVSMALAGAGARRIVIANRNKSRAEVLAKRIQRNFERETIPVALDESRALYWLIKESDLLVNATSVGLKTPERPNINPNCLHPKLMVYDLIYKETPLLKLAKRKGLKTLDGLGMLVSQGARSFEIFTGKRAPFKVMRAAAENALKFMK